MPVSYLPLYRKYRPQTLGELVGQAPIAQSLQNAIRMDKVAHAYLFTGSRGTGKTSTARILAKSLNCVEGPTATPCQICDSCLNITQGNDLDVVEFDAASNNGIDQARELVESTQFAPIAGRYKIYIIDEVHMLSTQAFNALLKTIEEPPPNVIFIFATTEAHKVLQTIVSRCQRFNFHRIATPAILQRLKEVCEAEGLTIEEAALLHIARQANGGLRDALSTLDQIAILARAQETPFTLKQLTEFLGQVEEESTLNLIAALLSHDAPALLSQIEALSDAGVEAPQVIGALQLSLRHLMMMLALHPHGGGSAEDFEVTQSSFERLGKLAKTGTPEQVALLLDAMNALEQSLKRAQNVSLTLETGLLSACMNTHALEVSSLLKRIETLEEKLAPGAAPSSTHTQPAMQQGPPQETPAMPPSLISAADLPPAPAPPSAPVMPPSLPAPVVPQASAAPPPVQAVAPQSAVAQASPAPAPPPPPVSGELGALHQQICNAMASPAARAVFIQQVSLQHREGHKLTLLPKNAAILKLVQAPDKLKHYREAANRTLGGEASIAFSPPPGPGKASGSSPAPAPAEEPQNASRSAYEGEHNGGLLQLNPTDFQLTTPAPKPLEACVSTPSSPTEPPPVASPAPPTLPPQAKPDKVPEPQSANALDAMPSLSFEASPPQPENPPEDAPPESLWEDDEAPAPENVPQTPALQASSVIPPKASAPPGSVSGWLIKGSGESWAEAHTFVRQLLHAKPLDEYEKTEASDGITEADTLDEEEP